MKTQFAVPALVAALLLAAGFASAAEPEQVQAQAPGQMQAPDKMQAPDQMQAPMQTPAQSEAAKPVEKRRYNSELMTGEERAKFRARMRGAKSDAEREKIRKEHHEMMTERAKARRVPLYDEPPEGGMEPDGGMEPGGR